VNPPSTPRVLVAAALTTGAISIGTPVASAGSSVKEAPEEHCVVHVLGQEENGRYITDEPTCYPTLAEALADAAGFTPAFLARELGVAGLPDVVALSGKKLATHFDGAAQTGSSITVSGVECDGGYVNLSSSWINRISSAINGCPNVNYYDGYDKTGTYEFTPGLGNHDVVVLNNAANSVGYA
jgi:hypothetical protein